MLNDQICILSVSLYRVLPASFDLSDSWCIPSFLFRQGGLLVNFHPSILSCLLPQLTSPRLAVRKRTIIALGHLVMSCGNLVFVDLIEHLLSELSRNDSMSTTRTYIQCIAAISRQAGHRIGEKMTFGMYEKLSTHPQCAHTPTHSLFHVLYT